LRPVAKICHKNVYQGELTMLPKRSEFFALLAAHSERVLASTNAMLRLITSLGVSKDDVAALIEEVNMNEASADQIKQDMLTMLHKAFVTPLNREQVYALTLELDSVVNAVQDVAQSVDIYHVTEATAASRALASMAVDACTRLNRAINSLKDKERSEETVNLCVEIERIEEKADAVMQGAIKTLFENEGDDDAALLAIRMRQFYSRQEKVLARCKESAQIIEGILIENS
jgi:predicted phosphate transport protein (TIGR00153 family)